MKPADLDQLEEIVGAFPFFQSARMVLAKGAKLNKSKKTKELVATAAVYVTDRKLLKKYLEGELIFLNPLQVHESHESEYERSLEEEIKTSRMVSTQNKIKAIPPPQAPKPPAQPRTLDQAVEEKRPAAPIVPAEVIKTVTPPANDELDQIIEELYHDLEQLKKNREELAEREKKLEEEEAVNQALARATKKSASKKKASNPALESPEKPAPVAAEKPEPTPSAVPVTTAEPAAPVDTPAAPVPPKKRAQEDIIAAFIKKNPSITPASAERKLDSDLSKDSITLHPEVASEYLAEIYLEQGRKERAIQIYETLMVKFPEKSVYFADIIKKLN